ncbi:MAG TPA: hypothetical protein VGF43_05625 [Dongiaceae bacterium]|jgi:uncharacterized cupredoxin-like copper-binding protein
MIRSVHSGLRFAAACAIAGAFAAPALADGSTVKVTLWDKGTSSQMAMDEGLGMTHASKADSNMGIRLSKKKVKAGEVTFEVTNSSKETVHEMLVIPAPADGKVPYDAKEAKFDEDKAGSLGEVEETDPGKAGKLTLNLKPGRYILSCNVANHFANGMWTAFTVE